MAATQAELSKTAGKPIHCRAAVARKAGEPLVIEEVIVAPPKACEVRIKIVCTSLCHSDVTFWKLKDFPGCFPRILGHEAFGIVESVGENVQDLKEGDSVIPIFLPDCTECIDCTSKKSNSCSQFQFKVSPWMLRDGSSRFTTVDGETLYHFLSVSSFAEYTVVDIANVTKIDPRVPPNRACLFSCGVSTGVGAALKTANVEQGSTVVIFGLGGIGLAVAEGARICGASRIIGVDINTDKFEIGKQFGVTDFVDSNSYGDKPISQVINEMTNGGADYCFECVGMGTLVEEAYACCRKGWGKTIVVGVDKPGAMLTFKSFDILHLGKTGSLFGGLKPKSDIPLLVKRYLDKGGCCHLCDMGTGYFSVPGFLCRITLLQASKACFYFSMCDLAIAFMHENSKTSKISAQKEAKDASAIIHVERCRMQELFYNGGHTLFPVN